MKSFVMELRDAAHGERIENVTSFVGEDGSGSFGLLAHHARFMTVLVFGLSCFRIGAAEWRYLAAPGALLYFIDNTLHLSTRRYLVGDDYQKVSAQLQERLVGEEQRVRNTKENLRHMEEEVLRTLWRLQRP